MVTRFVVQAALVVMLLTAGMSGVSTPVGLAEGNGVSEADLGNGGGRIFQAGETPACLVSSVDTTESATPIPDQRLAGGIPAGVSFTPLAGGTVDELPLLPAKLTLSRQTFEPGAEVPTTTATGPILFIVERGTLTIFLSGEGARYDPGAFALVRLGQRYSLVNEAGAAATVLRLAVDKLSALDAPVMRIEQLTPVPGTSAVRPTSSRLFQATIERLPRGTALLFVGCASWAAMTDDGVVHRHPGAVAMRMISGSLRIDDGLALGANGCRLFERLVPYRIQPGDDPPTAFLFGVIAENQHLWLTGEEGSEQSPVTAAGVPSVSCG
ncbi:MAG: cupin domain-containing protein [Thermomicrobiales bacterium]